jgi:hypothetical protein
VADLRHRPEVPGPHREVGGIERGGGDLDADLQGTRFRERDLQDLQDLDDLRSSVPGG